MKILMVCLGNICRSPLAEGILQQMADEHNLAFTVESAGTNGFHNGEAPHHLSQKIAKLNNIDISKQKSRKFIKEDFEKYDFIYAMANDVLDDIKSIAGNNFIREKVDLILNESHTTKNMDVPDPWYGGEDGYHETFALLNEACNKIIEKYKN